MEGDRHRDTIFDMLCKGQTIQGKCDRPREVSVPRDILHVVGLIKYQDGVVKVNVSRGPDGRVNEVTAGDGGQGPRIREEERIREPNVLKGALESIGVGRGVVDKVGSGWAQELVKKYLYGQKTSSACWASSLAVKYGQTLALEQDVLRSSMSWI